MYAEVILPQVRLQVDLKKEMNPSAPSLFHSINSSIIKGEKSDFWE